MCTGPCHVFGCHRTGRWTAGWERVRGLHGDDEVEPPPRLHSPVGRGSTVGWVPSTSESSEVTRGWEGDERYLRDRDTGTGVVYVSCVDIKLTGFRNRNTSSVFP